MDEVGDAGLGGQLGDVGGAERLRALEGLCATLGHDADEIDDSVGVLKPAFDRGAVADIGLDELNLTDIACQFDIPREVGAADGHADAPALAAEGADDMAAEETRAAENGDDFAGHADLFEKASQGADRPESSTEVHVTG